MSGVDVKIIGAGAFVQPLGAPRPRLVYKDETITLPEKRAVLLIEQGVALRTEDVPEPEKVEDPPGVFDAREADVDELIDWLTDEQPSAEEIAAAANHDKAAAERLLEAEGVVTDRNPRDSVTEALQPFLSDGNAESGTSTAPPVEIPADYNELKQLAKSLGLKASGSRESLTAAVKAKVEGGGGDGGS